MNRWGHGLFRGFSAGQSPERRRASHRARAAPAHEATDRRACAARAGTSSLCPGAAARLRVHRLRPRCGRGLPRLAGPTDDGALGRCGSRGRRGSRHAALARVPADVSRARESHQDLHELVHPLARSAEPARAPRRDRRRAVRRCGRIENPSPQATRECRSAVAAAREGSGARGAGVPSGAAVPAWPRGTRDRSGPPTRGCRGGNRRVLTHVAPVLESVRIVLMAHDGSMTTRRIFRFLSSARDVLAFGDTRV